MKPKILNFPVTEFETLQALMIQALSNNCGCISCKGLIVLATRIKNYNEKSPRQTFQKVDEK